MKLTPNSNYSQIKNTKISEKREKSTSHLMKIKKKFIICLFAGRTKTERETNFCKMGFIGSA